MNRYLKFIGAPVLILPIVWVFSSWYFVKQSSEALDDMVSVWQKSSTQYIAGMEVIDTKQGVFRAQKVVRITPAVPYLLEQFGDVTVNIEQKAGPVIFGEDGLTFARSVWVATLDFDESNEITDKTPAELKIVDEFTSRLQVSGQVAELNTSLWGGGNIATEGAIDLSNGDFQFEVMAESLVIYDSGVQLKLSQARLGIDSTNSSINSDAVNLIKVALNANNSHLINEKTGKNIRLNLSSAASVWKKSDTLDADLKVSFVNTLPLDSKETYVSVQLREWLTSGFLSYLDELAKSSDLLRQSEWALEEVETTEQQDFYRSLRYQAARVDRLQWSDIVSPMLESGKSQLAFEAGVDQSGEQIAKLHLTGSAADSVVKANLPLTGELKIISSSLDKQMSRLLRRWVGRGLLREYETAFESDIAIQGQGVFLNKGRAPLVRLKDELKRVLIDQ